MGPPIYIGGNRYDVLHIGRKHSRLQWGHRFTSVETKCSGKTRSPIVSFNGATDLHRWKRVLNRAGSPHIPALQWGHRFTSVETGTQSMVWKGKLDASMGPPIYIGGNTFIFLYICLRANALQWGHRFTSVETADGARGGLLAAGASMGPPIYIGGNFLTVAFIPHAKKASMGPPIYIGGN